MVIELVHRGTGKTLQLNAFWLRDHCRCDRCYSHTNTQRNYDLLDLQADVKALEAITSADGQQLSVKWSDGHDSVYDVDFLYESQVERLIERAEKSPPRIPWDQATIVTKNEKLDDNELRVSLPDLVRADGVAQRRFIRSLVRNGVAFIDEVPPNTTMTEMALRRSFPIMRSFYGEMFTISESRVDFDDTAYTRDFLGIHTDHTYFCDPAGLHSLHCINHDGTGGENFLVDGLHVALEMKRLHPEAYRLLTEVEVPAEYLDAERHHKHSAPIIRVDPITGEVLHIRLNMFDRAVFNTLPQARMQAFYEALRTYLAIAHSPEATWTFKLRPGTLMVFDNWRLVHGRHSYTGTRTMTGGYIQYTDFLSAARVHGFIE